MKIVIINDGTMGDMHPFFSLGRVLAERGHTIVFCTNDVYRTAAEKLGFRFVSTGTAQEYEAIVSNPDMWNSKKARVMAWKTVVVPRLRPLFNILLREVDDNTVILCGAFTAAVARAVQEKHDIPLVTTVLAPSVLLSAKRPPKGSPIPSWLPYPARVAVLRGLDMVIDSVMAPELNRFRGEIGLPSASHLRQGFFSPQGTLGLFPEWFVQRQSDWPAALTLTGFPLFDEGAHATDPVLEEFLSSGAAPVVFTAGTGMRHAHAFFAAAQQLLQRLGRRGVFLSKSAQQIPADLPPQILYRDYAPMSTLLPRSAALVHHGGIGTAAQALAAGIPQLVVPFAYDQFDNAERLRQLGCGASVKTLAAQDPAQRKLRHLLESATVRAACKHYQALIEPGRIAATRAVELVERAGRA